MNHGFRILPLVLLISMLLTLFPIAAEQNILISDCESTEGWENASLDQKEFTEGKGSVGIDFNLTSKNAMILFLRFPAVDATGCNTLEFDLYLSHPDLFEKAGECAIELTSSGTCDIEECFWYPDDQPLEKGWNHIALPISSGACRMNHLNFFRIYAVNIPRFTNDTISVKLDNIRVTNVDPAAFGPTVPAENLGSLKEAEGDRTTALPSLTPITLPGTETYLREELRTAAIILFAVSGALLIAFVLLLVFKKKPIGFISLALCLILCGTGVFCLVEYGKEQVREIQVPIPQMDMEQVENLLTPVKDFDTTDAYRIQYEVGTTTDTVTDPKWDFRTPTLIDSPLISDQYIIATTTVQAFGAKGDGIADDTTAFMKAIQYVSNQGGGTLFVPAGHYCITEPLTLPRAVLLCGELTPGTVDGTVLKLYFGKGNENAAAAFTMEFQSGIKNMAFWYPEQTFAGGTPIPYPYTIRQGGSEGITLENLNFVNSYRAIDMQNSKISSNSLQTIRDICGTPLLLGTDNSHSLDIGRFEGISFAPEYWLLSGLDGVPAQQLLTTWLIRNATAIRIGRVDWTYYTDVTVKGYGIGIEYYVAPSGSSNGHLYQASITDCYYPIYAECLSHLNYTKVTLSAIGNDGAVALYFKSSSKTEFNLNHCTLTSQGRNAIYNPSASNISLLACIVSSEGGSPLVITDKARYSAVNTTFSGENTEIYRSTSTEIEPIPQTDHDRTVVTKPSSDKLITLTDAPYNARNGSDITNILQKAIDDLKETGGTVYIPGGSYTVSAPITVHAGIELCGVQDLPHYFPSTTIHTDYGAKQPNADALFTLMDGAGMRGLGIHYNKIANHGASLPAYAYTIRGNGKNIYIVNCTIPFTYNAVDFATYRCDNHYIEYLWGCAANNAISVGGGSENGIIRDCMFTQNTSWTVKGDSSYIGIVQPILLRQSVTFRVGQTKNQMIYHTFVFAAHKGLEITDGAENCMVISHGTDYGNNAIYLSGNSTVTLIDPQMVAYSGTDRNYIQADKTFTGRLTVYNGACWGLPATAIKLKGDAEYRFYQIFFSAVGDHVFNVEAGSIEVAALSRTCDARYDFYLSEEVREIRLNGSMCSSMLRTRIPQGTTASGKDLDKK